MNVRETMSGMTTPTGEPGRPALGLLIRDRRDELGLSQRELAAKAGLKTRITVGNVEAGRDVKDWVLRRLDHALGWRAGSCHRFLEDGTRPVLAEPEEREEYTDPAEADVWALTDLSPERRREIIAELRAARGRARAQREAAEVERPLCGGGGA